MTNIEPLDFSSSRPAARFTLDPEEVSSAMLDISSSMTEPIRAFLADESEENWFAILDWMLEESSGSPNRKYAMVETIGILVWSFTRTAGMEADQVPDLASEIDKESVSEEETRGMQDALALLSSPGDPLDGLPDEWLQYAAEDFPEEQYVSAVGFWLFLLCGFLKETAKIAGMTPEALWGLMSETNEQ